MHQALIACLYMPVHDPLQGQVALEQNPSQKFRPTTESDHFFEKNILVGLNPQHPPGAPTSKAFLAFWLIAFIF